MFSIKRQETRWRTSIWAQRIRRVPIAAEVYQRALERFPNNGILHNNLGVIHRSRGDLDRATKAFQAAIRTTPGFAMPYFNLGLILQGAGYRREAIIAYERFLELAPGQLGTVPYIPKARERLSALRVENEQAPAGAPRSPSE